LWEVKKFMVSEELQLVEQSFLPMQRYAHVLWRNFLSLNAVVNLAWQGLIVETKVDASDVIIWTVVGQLSGQYLQRSAVGLSH